MPRGSKLSQPSCPTGSDAPASRPTAPKRDTVHANPWDSAGYDGRFSVNAWESVLRESNWGIHMTARRLLALGAASCAITVATPALAQPQMTYEQRTYEYAQPAPANGMVIYRQQPVVQQVPSTIPTTSHPVVQQVPADYQEYDVEYEHAAPAATTHHVYHGAGAGYPPMAHHPMPHPAPMPQHAGGYPYPGHTAYPGLPADFDRDEWLADCREGYRNPRRSNSGAVGGGILGAAVGGVIGNRVADGNRLAGTLIGAGVGGLAGLAIGSAIAGSGDRRRAREACEAWLDDYRAGRYGGGYWQQGGYGQHGYGYGYAHGYYTMTYVPVLVAVPQRAIVRETVTEEWVEERSHSHTYHPKPAAKRVIYRKAPSPTPVKRIKYRKGN